MAHTEPAAGGMPGSYRRGRGMLTALLAGLAGGLIAPLVYPAIARNARPAAKKALKAGMVAVERGRVIASEVAEQASDLLAEVQAEYTEPQAPQPPQVGSRPPREVVELRGSAGH